MVRNYFSLILFLNLFISSNLSSQTTAIPDAAFEQALIDLGIDSDGTLNGSVATSDIDVVTTLDISNKGIELIAGIEDFTNLTELYCQNNELRDIYVIQNTKLKVLNCSSQYVNYYSVINLYISENKDLEYLNCSNNPPIYGDLNPSLNPNLKTLICANIGLTSLNVSSNSVLEYLNCSNNYYYDSNGQVRTFTNLILGQNSNLTAVSCSTNEISSLDLTGVPNLVDLNCANNNLTGINLNQNTILEELHCQNNQLTSLYLTYSTNLSTLRCNNNQLTILNVKNGSNSNLTTFDAQNNPSLTCIEVDDADAANAGEAPYDGWYIDAIVSYSDDCSALGLDDELLAQSISLYPNPVSNILTIDSEIPLTRVVIYSILGEKVIGINSGFKSIRTDNLSNGVYIVKMQSIKGNTSKKLIKN